MTKKLQISWDEILALLERTYDITEIKVMKSYKGDSDSEICEQPDYILGKVNEL